MEQQHTISKFIFEVDIPSSDGSFDMQQAISNYCKDILPQKLSTWMNECAGDEELLSIDRLEVDLGQCSRNELYKNLGERIVAALNKKYSHLKQAGFTAKIPSAGSERKPMQQGHFESWLFYLEHGFLPSTTHIEDRVAWQNAALETIATDIIAVEKCQDLLLKDPAALTRLALQFDTDFLQSWARSFYGSEANKLFRLVDEWMELITNNTLGKLANKEFNIEVPAVTTGLRYSDVLTIVLTFILRKEKDNPAPALVEKLLATCFSLPDQHNLKLALIQLMPSHVNAFPMLSLAIKDVEWSDFKKQDDVSAIINTRLKTTNGSEPTEDKNRDGKLENNTLDDTGVSPSDLGCKPETVQDGKLVKELPGQSFEYSREAAPGDVKSSEASAFISPLAHDTRSSENKASTINEASAAGEQPVATFTNNPDVDTVEASRSLDIRDRFNLFKKKFDEGAVNAKQTLKPPSNLKKLKEGSSLYVKNAGLVLLNPFFATLFGSLDLLEEKQFKNEYCRDKAVELLSFIAFGKTNLQDDELILPKLLCGVEPHIPVDRFISLGERDKDAAVELLHSVIEHWKPLSNSSPDSLRANFLLREGKLDFKNDQWNLQVTQQVYDMLLNQLPWGFGLIKFSWMKHLLATVWV